MLFRSAYLEQAQIANDHNQDHDNDVFHTDTSSQSSTFGLITFACSSLERDLFYLGYVVGLLCFLESVEPLAEMVGVIFHLSRTSVLGCVDSRSPASEHHVPLEHRKAALELAKQPTHDHKVE